MHDNGIIDTQAVDEGKGASRLALRVSERRLLLGVVDLLLLNGSLILVQLLASDSFDGSPSDVWANIRWFITLSVLWYGPAILADLYALPLAADGVRSTLATGAAAIAVTSFYWLIPFLPPPLPERRLFVFALPIFAAVSLACWRLLYATALRQPRFSRRILIIGAGYSGRALAQALQPPRDSEALSTYQVLGFIDDALALQQTTVDGIPVLGDSAALERLVRQHRPDELVVAITHTHSIGAQLFRAILNCRETGLPVTTMPALYEQVTGRVPVEHAGRNLSVVMPVDPSASYRFYLFIKRMADIVVGAIGCLFLLGLIPAVWLANRLTDPGDLFYRQVRVGQGGRPYEVIKFRSMVMDAEKVSGAVWANEDDPRITPVGRWLRRTRLDEVPQFWNVLRGEMSLIGPRPERPHFVAQLVEEIPYYQARHAAKPGITGWAQVRYRYGASVDDALVKLQYDLFYIKHQGVALDLEIAIRTAQVMAGLKGR